MVIVTCGDFMLLTNKTTFSAFARQLSGSATEV